MAVAETTGHEVLITVEGERKPRGLLLSTGATIDQLLAEVRHDFGADETLEAALEDADEALAGHLTLEEISKAGFVLIHVCACGKIEVAISFNGRVKDREFRSNATVEKAIRWAMKAFGLEGEPADFQLKLGEEVVAAGDHLGQFVGRKKKLRLSLVMKIKPQGLT